MSLINPASFNFKDIPTQNGSTMSQQTTAPTQNDIVTLTKKQNKSRKKTNYTKLLLIGLAGVATIGIGWKFLGNKLIEIGSRLGKGASKGAGDILDNPKVIEKFEKRFEDSCKNVIHKLSQDKQVQEDFSHLGSKVINGIEPATNQLITKGMQHAKTEATKLFSDKELIAQAATTAKQVAVDASNQIKNDSTIRQNLTELGSKVVEGIKPSINKVGTDAIKHVEAEATKSINNILTDKQLMDQASNSAKNVVVEASSQIKDDPTITQNIKSWLCKLFNPWTKTNN